MCVYFVWYADQCVEVIILLMLMQLHKYAFYCSTIMAQLQNFSNAPGKRLNPLLSPNTITRTWMGLQKFNEWTQEDSMHLSSSSLDYQPRWDEVKVAWLYILCRNHIRTTKTCTKIHAVTSIVAHKNCVRDTIPQQRLWFKQFWVLLNSPKVTKLWFPDC